MVLNRPRHEKLIADIREAGARITLIPDGDIAAVIATASNSDVDMYVGTGGAPEGVLAAAALSTTGGQMMGRLIFDSEEQIIRAKSMGIKDLKYKYLVNDMVHGNNIIFVATGVTSGTILSGVRIKSNQNLVTHSLIMSSKYKTIQHIYTEHLN